MQETIVIGIGNPYRGDDGAGLKVARTLKNKMPPGVRVEESSGEIGELMELWKDCKKALAVDALSSGGPPGKVMRFEAHAGPLPAETFHYSTHGLSLAEAVELARAMNALPPRLVIFAIEGKDFTAGEALSKEVERACGEVTDKILGELQNA